MYGECIKFKDVKYTRRAQRQHPESQKILLTVDALEFLQTGCAFPLFTLCPAAAAVKQVTPATICTKLLIR